MHPDMDGFEPGLTAEDHAYRRAADAYFAEKGKIAHAGFEPKLLTVFLSFEDHWREFFAPVHPEQLREYLSSPFEVRKSQFERFRRECRSWEVSFRHCSKAPARPSPTEGPRSPGGAAGNSTTDWSDLKRRLDAQRSKADQVREFYDNLDNLLDKERQRRSHPVELLTHLRALGVSSEATLEEIKKEYKRLARIHHPDVKGDALRMSRINDAYRAILAFYKVA